MNVTFLSHDRTRYAFYQKANKELINHEHVKSSYETFRKKLYHELSS